MKTKKGFTLVELLVVIAIIGLLSTIAFISLNRARAKARDAKRISDVRGLQSAMELYYNEQTTPSYPLSTGATVMSSAILNTTYIAQVPQAPTPFDGPDCATDNQNRYFYRDVTSSSDTSDCTTTTCGWYEIAFCLGSATGGVEAGCTVASPSGIITHTEDADDTNGCF